MHLSIISVDYSDDITRAISKLKVLGSGFSIIQLAGTQDPSQILIRSVPGELTADHTCALKVAETKSFTSVSHLKLVSSQAFSNES